MNDIITIEMVDNGYIVRGEGFSQVIDVTQDKAENQISLRPHTPKHGQSWFMQGTGRNQHNKSRII